MRSLCKKHLYLLLGIAVTALTMPFGLTAAALASTVAGVSLVTWQHSSGTAFDADDMAFMLAGGAVYLLWAKAIWPTLG